VIDAQNGNIEAWTGGLFDAFSGSMTVGAGRHIDISHAWSRDGNLSLQGGSTVLTAAEIRDGAIAFSHATVNVD
jgi:hypothetical protein